MGLLSFRCRMADIKEIHILPKRHFVELIITSAEDGRVLNTICAENPELAALLAQLAKVAPATGFPIQPLEPLVPLGQSIYKVEREGLLALLGCFYTKTWADVQSMPKDFPATACYTFVVSF